MSHHSLYIQSLSHKLETLTKDWNKQIIQPQSILISHKNTVQSLQFNPQKKQELLTAGHDRLINRWDLQKIQIIDQFLYNQAGVWGIEFNKNGKTFYSC
jgi:WD40 repeat protein